MLMNCQTLKELLIYCPEDGLFRWAKNIQGHTKKGNVAGTATKYVSICLKQKRYYAHRLAWLYMYGCWPLGELDHIDRNKHNNRIENLRVVSRSENMQNTLANGAHFNKRERNWTSSIRSNGKFFRLGSYETEEEAKLAYKAAKRVLHANSPVNERVATEEDKLVLPTGLSRNNKSGANGVACRKGKKKFEAGVTLNGRYVYVGRYASLEEAVQARINFIEFHKEKENDEPL